MAVKERKKLTHFQEKSLSRVGTILDEQELINRIRSGELKFVKRSTRNITIWAFEYNKEMFNAVYDKERKEIATILYDDSNPKSRLFAFRGNRRENKLCQRPLK